MFSLFFIVPILLIIANWIIFEKMGEKGWKCLIPIYSQYLQCKLVGVSPWWILFNIGLPIFQPFIGIYFTILLNVSLAKSFGKKPTYAIGLILLPIIFIPILAFSSTEKYVGKEPMEDIILNNLKRN